MKNPVICALDTPRIEEAERLIAAVRHQIGAIKLGLEFFTAHGEPGIQKLACHHIPVFLDLKFHDIPNTVKKAVLATAPIECFMMTVHAAGGSEMLKAAVQASQELSHNTGRKRPLIVGVTVLTSQDERDLNSIGIHERMDAHVLRLAKLAQECGVDGVVCSPHEIEMLRIECGKDFRLVVPGIRPSADSNDDQKRTLTPQEAIAKGADYLVIGRPITQARDPEAAAKKIRESLGISA